MDEMLAKAAVAGQRVNTYTGTDYSGIEALRQQIVEQEQQLKSRLAIMSAARETHAAAHAEQAASQKEVVSLLERKTSWSPSDLDRYTSLIRSEHLHEQSVASARQALAAAETDLEDARKELERKERKQYHEEQIWSDTIRRNSTWVTFGLMGLNILLLVANIGIVEPWRRKRLVREVREALDAKTVTAGPGTDAEVKKEIDTASASTLQALDQLLDTEQSQPANSMVEAATQPHEVAVVLEPAAAASRSEEPESGPAQGTTAKVVASLQRAWLRTKAVYSEWAQGPLSNERIILTKAEVTSLAVEGVLVGVAVMSCIASLLRQR
ncbi:hypothetical protein ANO11243_081700 [Dothideomycetidae sp. 11243]|nr:hypothetical protein ANO11243_081700 [fungal sp. No.11243]